MEEKTLQQWCIEALGDGLALGLHLPQPSAEIVFSQRRASSPLSRALKQPCKLRLAFASIQRPCFHAAKEAMERALTLLILPPRLKKNLKADFVKALERWLFASLLASVPSPQWGFLLTLRPHMSQLLQKLSTTSALALHFSSDGRFLCMLPPIIFDAVFEYEE